ncbi:MAG TPA: beta-ketoacyl-[acyl-carrier-protein] synthase family protein [Candidatus Deferrimicrobiaceae bacterium]
MNGNVVVTGMGVISPLNPDGDLERFWSRLKAGENAVMPIRSFDASRYPCRVAAEIPREQLESGEGGDPAMRMARIAFRRAIQDAGPGWRGNDPRKAGVVLGTVLGGVSCGDRYFREPGMDPAAARTLLRQYPMRGLAASLAGEAGVRGPVLTVSTACASGTDAVGLAFRKVRAGEADVVVAGGVDAVAEFSFSGFCALNALTTGLVRPFSKNRSGLALGEGAAFLVVEREAVAVARGARILGRVAGYGSAADAAHLTAPDRDGRGLAAAGAAALREAGLAPARIQYVSAHGTGTLYNDWMETRALKSVLGTHARAVPVSSIKAVLGHAFGAAGALEAAACLLSIRDGVVPPTANFEEPDPECDVDCVPNRARAVPVRAALSLSAGFGGQNAAIVLAGC